MSILNTVEKSLRYAVSQTTSVTKEFMEITKLNSAINAREREIDLAYAALGRLLFEREAADPESPAAALCKKILDNQTAVSEMNAKIEALKVQGKEDRRASTEEFHKKPEPVVIPEENVKDVADEEPAADVVEEVAEAVEEVAEETVEAAEEVVEEVVDAVVAEETPLPDPEKLDPDSPEN